MRVEEIHKLHMGLRQDVCDWANTESRCKHWKVFHQKHKQQQQQIIINHTWLEKNDFWHNSFLLETSEPLSSTFRKSCIFSDEGRGFFFYINTCVFAVFGGTLTSIPCWGVATLASLSNSASGLFGWSADVKTAVYQLKKKKKKDLTIWKGSSLTILHQSYWVVGCPKNKSRS